MENLNIGYNFWTIRYTTFILGIYLSCIKTFPSIQNWPYDIDLTIDILLSKSLIAYNCEPIDIYIFFVKILKSITLNQTALTFDLLNEKP